MRYMLAAGMALLGIAAVVGLVRPGIDAATETVGVADNVFQPASITINAGDTVMWDWTGTLPHSVTADDNSFDSGVLTGTTNTFSQTFNTPGTYAYFCAVHGAPGAIAMAGTITVQQLQDTPTATNTTAATNTPGTPSTSEPTDTPVVTNTPEPTFTTQQTATPVVIDAIPISATEPSGGAAALPSSGAGSGRAGHGGGLLAVALGAAGAALVAVAGAARLVRRA